MTINPSKHQTFGFHLVSKSPWPILLSFSLFNLAIGAVLCMQGFNQGNFVLSLGLIITIFGMILWFRDIVIEGMAKATQQIKKYYLKNNIFLDLITLINNNKYINVLKTARALSDQDIKIALNKYKVNSYNYNKYKFNSENLGYYLAGLLEGDGNISIPALFKNSTFNRILNPRIVFTSHINNLGLYSFIQSELGNIGRFQITGNNTLRYIIGDIKGLQLLIKLMHGKLKTPKNITFNNLIKFMNNKYYLNIPESSLDTSNFSQNCWLTGFTDSDGYFGIKYVESKAKSGLMKRSRSEHVTLKFRIDQRAFDTPTSSSMLPFMEELALFLDCPVKSYSSNKTKTEVLSLTVSAIDKLELLINYFNKYPLLGEKINNYKNWLIVYNMMIKKEHLTAEGKIKIKSLIIIKS